MKECAKCKIKKSEDEFGKRTSRKDGLLNHCKNCVQKYTDNRRETIRKNGNKSSDKHRDKLNAKSKRWRKDNPEKTKENKKRWDSQNKDHIREYATKRGRKLYQDDVQYRLTVTLRNRINTFLRNAGNTKKAGSAVRDLGCSIEELKQHLESHFEPGMTWKNHGNKPDQWNIDHEVPLSWFDLANREQLLMACRWDNLYPMWSDKNNKKSNKHC